MCRVSAVAVIYKAYAERTEAIKINQCRVKRVYIQKRNFKLAKDYFLHVLTSASSSTGLLNSYTVVSRGICMTVGRNTTSAKLCKI
jgi:hypothetical protein